jgi:excinuclease UvrABC nuclease subunit
MSGHEQAPRVTNHYVYRLHGAGGEVIYVGRSVNVARRIAKHNTFPRKPWIEDVRSVSMFGPLSREKAIAAERQEIARLQPSGNIALTARDHRPFVAHMSTRETAPASAALTMAPDQWIGALADAWWLGHRDACNDCNCREDSNPYHVRQRANG